MPFWGWIILVFGLLLLFGYIYDKRSKRNRNIDHYKLTEEIKNAKAHINTDKNDFNNFF